MSVRLSAVLVAAMICPPVVAGPPEIPADIVAMLVEHRGVWHAEGVMIDGDRRTPARATWECRAAVNGVGNVCTWNHEWTDRPHDAALEIMGYDPEHHALSITRVSDKGIINNAVVVTVKGKTMLREWTFDEGGKHGEGRNEIVVTAPGQWSQVITRKVDGKVVGEFRITHRRVE